MNLTTTILTSCQFCGARDNHTPRPRTAICFALEKVILARLAHEAEHGVPDDYNGTDINPKTGKKMRLYAYSKAWWDSQAKWQNAWDELMTRRFK